MKELHEFFSTLDESRQQAQLLERVSELEAENARLRQLEETVRRNAKLVRALLQRSQEGISLATPQMTVLRTMHSVLGNTNDKVVGRSLLSVVHSEDHARVQDAFSRLADNPSEGIVFECRVGDMDGQWVWLEVEMTDMLDDPDVQAIVLNNRNITQRRKCQEASPVPESERDCSRCQGDGRKR